MAAGGDGWTFRSEAVANLHVPRQFRKGSNEPSQSSIY
jgi:hypothetical protein